MSNRAIKAVAVFNDKIKGTVYFTEDLDKNEIIITLNLSGLNNYSNHGFHVHEAGDLTDKCISMCAHFNPLNKNHGYPHSNNRHVGDLGNIISDSNGNANYTFTDNIIKLRGKYNIIGRGLVIHEDEDDGGTGDNDDSLITGNSGKRIGCAVIGYAKEYCKNK